MSQGSVQPFGTLDGTTIEEITIRSRAGAVAKVLTLGAVLRDLIVPGANGPQRVCLGLNSVEDYRDHSPHFGAVPGRFANRIANGRFTLDGHTYELPRNEDGITTLHGGFKGFGTIPWRLAASTESSVTLTLHSADGDQGFPGALDATCTYSFVEPATLRIELEATTDAPTVVNLTHHAYFNLDGAPDILDHELTIHGARRTMVDGARIPTGEIAPVAGTPFDFRQPRPIRNPSGQTYDLNYVLDEHGAGRLAHAARAHASRSGVTLDVWSDQPGIQLYDGLYLHCPVPGLEGARYGRHGGFCLEAQLFPDSPNHPEFPSSVLRPGERYSNTIEFRFS